MTTIVAENDILIEKLVLGPYETNCYIVVCKKTRYSLVVDAPAEASEIIHALQGTVPQYILLTHGHGDHTGALASLRTQLQVPLAAHATDSATLNTPPEMSLEDGDVMTLGRLKITVLHTPGHTPGSLCFITGKFLIAGDTIFPGGPGKTRSPESFTKIIASITGKILILPDATAIFPGHGEGTTVGKSKEEYAAFDARPHRGDLCGDVLWASS